MGCFLQQLTGVFNVYNTITRLLDAPRMVIRSLSGVDHLLIRVSMLGGVPSRIKAPKRCKVKSRCESICVIWHILKEYYSDAKKLEKT